MPDTAPVVDPAESSSLADHEQSFLPSRDRTPPPAPVVSDRVDDGLEPDVETAAQQAQRERDDKTGQFKPERQRARSQQAGKDDVEKINAYTKRIREAEESLGIKVEKQPGESDRVYNLRRRAELLEAKREVAKVAPAVVSKPAPKAPEPFNEPEP